MTSLLHYPGGKKRIAPWIIGNMPEHHSNHSIPPLWVIVWFQLLWYLFTFVSYTGATSQPAKSNA